MTAAACADDLRAALAGETPAEQKRFVRSFVQEITVKGGEATIRYTIPLPPKGSSCGDEGGVLSIVKFGGPEATIHRTFQATFTWRNNDAKAESTLQIGNE